MQIIVVVWPSEFIFFSLMYLCINPLWDHAPIMLYCFGRSCYICFYILG